MPETVDPKQLSLVELRALRSRLQNDDDAVSYVRRLAQARLDLVQAEKRHRADGGTESLSDELPSILSTHLTGGAPRPPRPANDFSSHPLAEEFDGLMDRAGDNDLSSFSSEELVDKTKFYLSHPEAAEALREAGYQRARRDHTWVRRFEQLFREIGMN